MGWPCQVLDVWCVAISESSSICSRSFSLDDGSIAIDIPSENTKLPLPSFAACPASS
jgi:hypothetical protein